MARRNNGAKVFATFREPPRLTAANVAKAEAEAERLKRVWGQFGCRVVSDGEADVARTTASQAAAAVRLLESQDRWTRTTLRVARVLKAVLGDAGPAGLGWLPCSLLLATPAPALVAAVLVLGGVGLGGVLVTGLTVYLLAAVAFATTLYPFRRGGLAGEVERLERRLALREDRLRELRSAHEHWRTRCSHLQEIRSAGQAYEAARKRHQEIAAEFQSRRNQLLHGNWRALRDTAFEDFLAEVFQGLGYAVERTAVTGDQGADLLLTGKGRSIAVQAKGWEGSVGNKAVMEVLAGKLFYRCTECAVVTNSRFTAKARELAQKTRCLLIGGEQIPDLIKGRIL